MGESVDSVVSFGFVFYFLNFGAKMLIQTLQNFNTPVLPIVDSKAPTKWQLKSGLFFSDI
jgi:hypothetical protein